MDFDLLARTQIAIGALSEGFVRMSPGRVNVVKTRPLSRHLSIVTKGEPADEVLAVIKLLKSAQAKKLFRQESVRVRTFGNSAWLSDVEYPAFISNSGSPLKKGR